MFGFKPYNYSSFSKDVLLKDIAASKTSAGSPHPGDRAPSFEARSLEGDRISLSDFEGKQNVVLTFGSATCPMTVGSVRALNNLYDEYNGEDVQFLFVYVREAHPGNDLPAHESMDDKIAAAELLREEEDVEMPILVDDLKGTIHKRYGKWPNATYIIDKSGRVAFRSLWSRPRQIEAALDELLERQQERDVEHAIVNGGEDTSMPVARSMLHTHRALERGGDKAIEEFQNALGVSGRVAVVTSRVAEPVALHPGRVALGALLASGVIAGALYAGHKLREKRLGLLSPYDLHEPTRRRRMAPSGGDYEAVGI
jgi:glutathione peroxidase-family protein